MENNKEKSKYLLGFIGSIILLLYSAYNFFFFDPVYVLECRDEFNIYNIETTNVTEFNNVYKKCLDYAKTLNELNNPPIQFPTLNFSHLLNNT